ncbi:hypothetical protein, partial [uncultured Metabacillus sp.]|uniref:hypothetical protein n=1 Tax=uncultured Metabacillus sp. TaxID=2860135 RepID=UPI00260E321C
FAHFIGEFSDLSAVLLTLSASFPIYQQLPHFISGSASFFSAATFFSATLSQISTPQDDSLCQ